MLGNDVVDLELALTQSNWRRKNYLSKIFSFQEQEVISEAANPDVMVWLFWSMKEASYKVINRITKHRDFTPLAYNCASLINSEGATGEVNYKGTTLLCQSKITGKFIHTVAFKNHLSFSDIKVIDKPNRKDYHAVFNNAQLNLQLIKGPKKLPEIYDQVNQCKYLASVSHHGAYLSIAYLCNK